MRLIFTLILLMVSVVHGQPAPEPAPGVERSALFLFKPGDRIDDAGVMNVTGGRFDRREAFEFVSRTDGSRILTSVTVAAGGLYRVEGRWLYTRDGLALSANGVGSYEGDSTAIAIRRDRDMAELSVGGAARARHRAWCPDNCLMDMSPSAMAMFTMTRRYDQALGGPQVFRWVGRSLIVDQVLLDGTAEIIRLGEFGYEGPNGPVTVRQYRFEETLKDEASGQTAQVAFNLYTDHQNRPLAFATAGSTRGERLGYEGITSALPPRFD